VRAGEQVGYVRALTLPDGKVSQIQVDLIPHADERGAVVGAFVLIVDITRHHETERLMRESEERMRKFAQATTEGIFFHHNGTLTDVNDALLSITGYTREEMIGHNTLEFVPEDSRQRIIDYIRAGSEFLYECDIVRRDGRRIPVEMIGKTVQRDGQTHRLGVLRDISERRRAEAHIRHLARHDPLTGLPNRMFLEERLEGMLALARRHEVGAAVLFIDLDDFKDVNDSLGHHAGDAVLREIAMRLKGALREADLVARLGGDEFLVVLADIGSPDDAGRVAEKLIKVIGAPVELEGRAMGVTPSIGISLYPDDGTAVEDLIRKADAAMYRAKYAGRAAYRIFAAGESEGGARRT
jgi:diguanylate cyclase (GGDEF)-like protein/PAS domain S-box-containing protein